MWRCFIDGEPVEWSAMVIVTPRVMETLIKVINK
jgi:hypothetical protein